MLGCGIYIVFNSLRVEQFLSLCSRMACSAETILRSQVCSFRRARCQSLPDIDHLITLAFVLLWVTTCAIYVV